MSSLVETNRLSGRLALRHALLGTAVASVALGVAVGVFLFKEQLQPASIRVGGLSLQALPRLGTGHQRAGRMAFDPEATTLAITCPRYNRLVLFGLDATSPLEPSASVKRDLELAGRPVAVQHGFGRLFLLQRPAGDARHLEPAFWQVCDLAGNLDETRFPVGYDPDDMVFWEEARLAFVLLSGRAEGETNRPAPSLKVLDMRDTARPAELFEHSFDQKGDDPRRLVLHLKKSDNQKAFSNQATLAVTLGGSDRVSWLQLDREMGLRELKSVPFPGDGSPDAAAFTPEGSLLVTDARGGPVWRMETSGKAQPLSGWGRIGDLALPATPGAGSGEIWLGVQTDKSGLAILRPADEGSIAGVLPLRGPMAFGQVEPIGLAMAGRWLAVCDRSGGVHLIRLNGPEPVLDPASPPKSPHQEFAALPPKD